MRAACLCLALLVSSSCSPARMGMNRMAEALSATAAAYSRDDDPEFVRLGAPATLKMVEMMLDTQPLDRGLLQTACSGFAQYAYAFLHLDSEIVLKTDPASAGELRRRALGMYSRARGYCTRALATRHPRLREALQGDFAAAVRLLDETTRDDVPELYWTGAAWAGEFSLAEDQIVRLPELAVVRALLERALALHEGWADGAIHEAMIAVEGLPVLLGGSPARARAHFDRAVQASGGHSAFPYVTLAVAVAVPAGDRTEFERLLKQALSVDVSARPGLRLANLIAQRRARFLWGTADALFTSAPRSLAPGAWRAGSRRRPPYSSSLGLAVEASCRLEAWLTGRPLMDSYS